LRLVDAGNIVHAADPTGLLVIARMDLISVIFTIPEDQLQGVLAKAAARQTLELDPLRELHPPDHLISSLPAASVGALLALLLTGHDLDIIGIILLIGIVKKNAPIWNSVHRQIRGNLRDQFDPRLSGGVAAAVPADPDDDDGRAAWGAASGAGRRHRLRIAPPTRNHDHRRVDREPVLTRYTTPVVYLYLDGVQQWLARRRGASRDRV
jgi:hypothetical protein